MSRIRPAPAPALHAVRRSLVVAGELVGALLLAPVALLLLVPLLALGGLLRAIGLGLVDLRVLPRRRTLEVDAEGAALSWSGAGGDTEATLADGFDLLLEAARRSGDLRAVRSVALAPEPDVGPLPVHRRDGSFGLALASRLDGTRVAFGSLVVNDGELRLAVEVDARSDRAGRLAVELPSDRWLAWTRVLLDLAPSWGFRTRADRLQLPAGEAGSAAA